MSEQETLATLACEACRADAPKVEGQALQARLKEVPEWSLIEMDGVQRLRREFAFPDFSSALDFVVKVGELAEEANHHPLVTLEWGRVVVDWWSHKIHGLHLNDFILAARTDAAY